MAENQRRPSALGGYRVVDLADERGEFCAWLLGALGADVVKVEDPALQATDTSGGRSVGRAELTRLAYNSNKRSIGLSLENEEGRGTLRNLLRDADFLIESSYPGTMARLGLDYQTIQEEFPRLIYVSISHFGQTGPYANYQGSDLVHIALSSLMYTSGDVDRPPVRPSVPQSFVLAGSHAAAGALLALAHRRTSGAGQHVDQSIQQSILLAAHNHPQFFELNDVIVRRSGEEAMSIGGLKSIIQCKDGWVCIGYLFQPGNASLTTLSRWMQCHGHGDLVHKIDWNSMTPADAQKLAQETAAAINSEISDFCLTQTKQELNQGAVDLQLFLYAASTVKDLYEMDQLKSREFFVSIELPDGSAPRFPGAFAVMSETPITIHRRAPLLGEHTEELLAELSVQASSAERGPKSEQSK